jgi:hypothetical protein
MQDRIHLNPAFVCVSGGEKKACYIASNPGWPQPRTARLSYIMEAVLGHMLPGMEPDPAEKAAMRLAAVKNLKHKVILDAFMSRVLTRRTCRWR